MKRLLCIFALAAMAMADNNLKAVFKKSNDQFSANMLQEVVKDQGNKSFVLSAFSVLSPLAQLALASVGASHDEILKAIGFPNDNVTKQIFTDMNNSLRSLKNVDLELANKIYIPKDYCLNKTFAALSKEIFNSEVENIDFQQKSKAAAEINAWIENHTHKRIKDVISPMSIDVSTAAVLVNSIYFKGKWKIPFKKYLTKKHTFHLAKNLTSMLPMMHRSDYFKYAESKEFDAKFLEMEYKGGEMSFVVALPNKIDGINDLIQKMKNSSTLNKALKDMCVDRVRVSLPKFKIETTTNLVDVLEKMNITKLFQAQNAKLYNLLNNTEDFYIGDATQKAFIDVNEEGVEATVVDEFIIFPFSDYVYYIKEQEFKADHPFLFYVMERNNILFSGVYRS